MKTGTKEVSKHPINPIHRDLIIVLVTSLGVAALVVAIGVLIFG